ncbi:centrosomal protein of 192 kDa isoform X5 [Trachypithecus francoisi]|uniref:centrosomal protein of 192 kDa isoform X5 n=1 Tax=Trachypithecus francoisi TaxID=54180 RepID=UPI00141A901B|nr:centrosomal protein of 192 kDa isoform X5 [Trachypithecus francoisi]
MTIVPFAVSILKSFDWRFYCSKISFFSKFQLSGQKREMEDFRGIAEESFPSFLTNSLFGNSGILENVTLSSNLGLPVAVSTLARNRSSTDNRYPDVQSSYLVEGRFSVPSGSSSGSQSDAEPRERLQLSFQDDDSVSRKKSCVESQRLSNALSKQSAFQMETAGPEEEPAGATESLQNQDLFNRASPLEQAQDSPIDFRLQSRMNDKEPKIVVLDAGKHFEGKTQNSDLSHTSLLENEKLMLPASLEDSSDDDIDDEMFYDDHLEAYFQQLAIPGMIYEDLEGPEPAEKGFKLPTNDLSQANENGSLNCKFQSENNSSLISLDSHSSETTHKESEESQVFCLPGTSNSVGTGGSRRHTDVMLPFSSGTWGLEKEIENVKGIVPDLSSESTSKDVLVKTLRTTDLKLNSDNFHDANANKGGFDPTDPVKQGVECPHQNKTVLHMDGCLDTETPTVSIQENVDVASLKPISDSGINFSDALWSPTCERRTCERHESVKKNKDKTDLPQSVVYQNEEGRWVTDLAYYTSFNSKQHLNVSLSDEMNEDFRSGSEAFDLIAQDEEEFNKEHQFIQPSFGYFIRSPEKREPIALIRKSDVSRGDLEKEMTHLNHDLYSGDLNEQSQAQLSEGSITLQVEAVESTSQVDENDVTLMADKGKTEDTFFMSNTPQRYKDKLPDSGDSVLRISTIASAIAEASVNTDPSQLAAMIKALSNKTRDKTFQEDEKQKDCSHVCHFLPNDLEKSNGSNAFDMEKYLKKTEVSRYESALENFSRTGVSDTWDLSLPKEQITQDIHTVNLSATNVSVREPEENTAAVVYVENGERESQESSRTVKSSNSITNMRENSSAVVDGKTCSIDNKLQDVGNNEKTTSVSTPSESYSSVRSSRITSLCLLKECEEIRDSRENQRQNECVSEISNSEKHVIFKNHCIVSPKNSDLKSISPEHGGRGSEDEQESFRPSTSPLSHSSPSEISGTSSSGCALESFGSAAQQQQPPCKQELSPLACSPPGVSRLTYVSEPESSYPTTTTDDALEDRKSDTTSELSTTIIQGSPVALEERAMEKLREKVPFQNRGKGTLSSVIQNNSDTRKATETTSLSSKAEYVKPDFKWSKDPSSKSGNLLDTNEVGLTSNPEEVDLIRLALLGKSGLSCQVGSATSRPVSCQEPVDEDQRIIPKDKSTAGHEFSGQVSHQTTSENQCTPIPSSTVCGSVADMHNVPAAVHALLTQPSLSTAPFAQRCLGTLPSAGSTTLPQCHAGSATVCGFSGGLPYPAVAGEPVQNSLAVGICLGSNIGSGWMGTSSLCNPYSNTLNQNLLSATKPFPVPSVGTNCGIEPWDSGMTSGLGSVRVPEELKLPHACCVGIASQTLLSVLNPTDRWLQVSIGVLSVSVNGEKVDLSTYRCLVFKNKAIIRPHTTEEIKVLFIPSSPGVFRCTFSVASWPCSTDAETIVQAEALASTVTLTAIAESPVIEVETEKKDVLDFGDLTYGGWKALPLKLINRTHATVPIRLIINANAAAWRCFMFSKEPVRAPVDVAPCTDVVTRLAGPSVVSHVMPASYDGQDPEFLMIWVLFHSPKKQISSSEVLDSAEEFSAKVDIEVDSPNPTPVLRSVSLRARAGIARIHAPRDLQTMHFLARVASSTKQHLPLKNAGNIEVYLDIKVPEQGSHFSVDPKNLFLKPGEEHEVIVSFTPKDPEACEERMLKILVQPCGPQYEVMLKGEVISSGSKPLSPGPCLDIPSILSNKQFLTWGGVPLGRTQLQKLALRNNSASTTQHLRLLIRGQDQDCFQLQNTFGSEQRLTSNCEIRIHPKEDIIISVLFAPTRLSCMLARLEIKQLGNRSQPGVKFTIPLSGYGGTSNLILEGVKKLSDSYMVTVNGLVPGKESKIVFSVRNTGSRAAFVKAVGFKDSQKKILLDPKVLRIFPDKFVLKERTQEDVTLIYNPSDRGINNKTATELSTVYLFGGDEISRQQYRRALLHKPEMIKGILPEHSVFQNINFVEAFQDELLVTEVYDLPQRPNDVQLFYGSMCKIILSVIGEFRDCISSREFLQPSSKASLESTSDLGASGRHGGNISLDVLPVKGPQGSPLLSQAARPPPNQLASEEPWTVLPEHLILVAPSPCDMAKTECFQIVNNSVRLLRFELCWPAHCLTVTPQHGCVAPESKLQILVSPNSSLSTKQSVFPWSGLIYIHCDAGRKKIVKVQIREDLTQVDLLTRLTSKPFGILSPVSEPSVSHLVKPMTKPPSTKVEIRNKSITFPTTEPGETSESCLELENHGTTDVKWHLSSLAPPYVKGADESGDVFRATYAAFRCSPISGLLESHGIQKVSITFLPRGRGDYAQFWDVECHPLKEPHMKHTSRFQLSGQSIEAEKEPENAHLSTDSLIKIDHLVKPRRQAVSEASARIPEQLDVTARGVYAPEDVYRFLPTSVGESRTLKVNLRNNSFITHSLKFLSPREPFYVRHSKYSLRAQHYINMPVQFKPKSAGKFEALLVIQTDEGKSIAIRLIGEALGKN